jgi:hypothetical protein
MTDIVVLTGNINFGLKSVIFSITITTALRPWLLNNLIHRVLALNSYILIIPDIHS